MALLRILATIIKKQFFTAMILPLVIYILASALDSSGLRMMWLKNLGNILILYGIIGSIILGYRMARENTIQRELIARVGETANSILLLVLASGPIFGRAPGALGLGVQLQGYIVTDLTVSGNVLGLLLILILLKLSSLRKVVAQIYLGGKAE